MIQFPDKYEFLDAAEALEMKARFWRVKSEGLQYTNAERAEYRARAAKIQTVADKFRAAALGATP